MSWLMSHPRLCPPLREDVSGDGQGHQIGKHVDEVLAAAELEPIVYEQKQESMRQNKQ